MTKPIYLKSAAAASMAAGVTVLFVWLGGTDPVVQPVSIQVPVKAEASSAKNLTADSLVSPNKSAAIDVFDIVTAVSITDATATEPNQQTAVVSSRTTNPDNTVDAPVPAIKATSFSPVSGATRDEIASQLFDAAEDADSRLMLGPFTACFDQMRAIACPIVGAIPVLNDIVGRVFLELGVSCPMGQPNSRI